MIITFNFSQKLLILIFGCQNLYTIIIAAFTCIFTETPVQKLTHESLDHQLLPLKNASD
jgi:hypothetical protein